MKGLQILNAAVLVIGAVMALNLAVVCLLYGVNLDFEPRLRTQMPNLFALTALFAALGAAGAGAFFGQRRQWTGRWALQALPLVPVIGLAFFLAGLRS